MSTRLATRLAWSAFGVSALVAAVAIAIGFAGGTQDLRSVAQPFAFLLFSLVGAAIASRERRNPIGWLFVGLGVAFLVLEAKTRYVGLAALIHAPGRRFASWLDWMWPPLSGVAIFVVPLLFPTGRLLSPRWRVFLWSAVLFALIGGLAGVLAPGNPFGLHVDEASRVKLDNLSVIPGAVALFGTVASLVVRFRRASALERLQLKWFLVASLPFILGFALHGAIDPQIQQAIVLVGLIALPLSVGFSILRYRLYDIDVVINKSLVYGALAAFISIMYVGIVVGVGSLFGNGGRPNLALSIVATAIVAIAFQAVREQVQRLANRLVYGERATPYEVMADFSNRMSGTIPADEVLPRIAETAARSVGAPAARITQFLPDGERRTAEWPSDFRAGELGRTFPISYRGERIAELAIGENAGAPLRPSEAKLLADLAGQAGLVLHNVRLTVELQARLAEISSQAAELRASRQRLVSAQDAERERLERTIHDGAERRLAEIADALNTLPQALARRPEEAIAVLERLTLQASTTLEELRDVARGVYPPLLREHGLKAALEAQTKKIGKPVSVEGDGLGRYSSEVEVTVYFCCLEAMQRATGPAEIRLASENGRLEFSIRGVEPLDSVIQQLDDRVQALGGQLIEGAGTLVGSIPVDQFFFAASHAAVSRSGSNFALEM